MTIRQAINRLVKHLLNYSTYRAPTKLVKARTMSIQLKSLLVAEERGNHPISRYSANQIAPFQPRDTKLAVPNEFLSTPTKVEMATELQSLPGIFFHKSVEPVPLHSL